MIKPKFHPNSVRKVLKNAHVEQSKWHASSMVKGWGHTTRGFKIETTYGEKQVWRKANRAAQPDAGVMVPALDTSVIKEIRVEWKTDESFRGDHDAEQQKELAQLAVILKGAGFTVESVDEPRGAVGFVAHYLRVTVGPPDTSRNKWVRSNEDWYPTIEGNSVYPNPDYCNPLPDPAVKVRVSQLTTKQWRVSVWGGDDYGLEIDLPEGHELEAQHLFDNIKDYVTQDQLFQWGFTHA